MIPMLPSGTLLLSPATRQLQGIARDTTVFYLRVVEEIDSFGVFLNALFFLVCFVRFFLVFRLNVGN